MALVVVILGLIPIVVGLWAAAVLLNGWLISLLWGWFIVPTFHFPALSIPQAIGIALVAGLLTHQYVPSKDGDKAVYYMPVLIPACTLLVAWVLHTWFWI